jgi:hypothetical protein
MKKRIKILISVILSCVMIFIIYHLFWHFTVLRKYEAFRTASEFQEINEDLSYLLIDGDIVYNVEYPFYLSLVGNLAIQADEGNFVLIIWPRVFGETTFGLMIFNEESGQTYSIELDTNRNVLDERFLPVIAEHNEFIDYLFDRVYQMWGIGTP